MSKELFTQIQDQMVNEINRYENGDRTALETLLYLRGFNEMADEIKTISKEFESENILDIEAEINKNNGSFGGYKITKMNGRKTFDFSNIYEVTELNKRKKEVETKYKTAFDGVQKGITPTTEIEGVRYWVDADGEIKPFPEVKQSSGYVTIKKDR